MLSRRPQMYPAQGEEVMLSECYLHFTVIVVLFSSPSRNKRFSLSCAEIVVAIRCNRFLLALSIRKTYAIYHRAPRL
jgi:hypothetical protein